MLTLVLGGISSGKSRFAVELAGWSERVLVLAPGQALDGEMEARIEAHRKSRPAHWEVSEEPLDLPGAAARSQAEAILVESIDAWVANRLEAAGGAQVGWTREALGHLEDSCVADLDRLGERRVVAVSSEVGLSLVPLHPYGRAFADLVGRVNQRLAATADEVYLVVAGIPILITSLMSTPDPRSR